MESIKRKIIIGILMMLVILGNETIYAVEQVNTQIELEDIGKHKQIFIAGNPNLAPIESYDGEKYTGIIPDLFKKITEISGIEFRYINDKQDWKEYAENNQVEIISGIEAGINLEPYHLRNRIDLVSFPVKDEEKIYSIAFTEIADDSLIEIIKKSLEQITEFEMQEILIANTTNGQSNNEFLYFFILIVGILLLTTLVFYILYKKYKQETTKAKYVDNITHLGNYQLMERNFDTIITDQNRTSYCIINMGIDISHIEELYGYPEVERILKVISRLLDKEVNKHELFARIYKDSFVIMADYTSEKNITERITRIIQEIKDEMKQTDKTYGLYLYAGIYVLSQTDTSLDNAVYKAMLAKKTAKEQGTLVKMCTQALILKAKIENNLENEMLVALKNDEFVTYVQALMNIRTGKIQCLEALARWENPKVGLVKPNSFISIFEKNNIIDKLDFHMLENTCKMLSSLITNNKEVFTVFCNFSKKTIDNKFFLDRLEEITEKYHVPKQYIGIVVREEMVNYDMVSLKMLMEKLKKAGFAILLDDFDSATYSFEEIAQFHVDYIRMPLKLTESVGDEKTTQIVKKVLEIFHELNIQVIGRDIKETREDEQVLKEIGYDIIQSRAYYPPMPIEEFSRG